MLLLVCIVRLNLEYIHFVDSGMFEGSPEGLRARAASAVSVAGLRADVYLKNINFLADWLQYRRTVRYHS